MDFPLSDKLSPELKQFLRENQTFLDSHIKPCVEMKLVLTPKLSRWQSKVGGVPYWPKDLEYPVEDTEQPLKLLAQINLEDVPVLPDFPQKGILQFYIDPADEAFGVNIDDLESYERCRVVYFSDIETDESLLITDFSFIPEFEDSPIQGEAGIQFEKKLKTVPSSNFRFDTLIAPLFDQDLYDLYDEYMEYTYHFSHQIGGYSSFTQTDPRCDNEDLQAYDRLLLQLDSEHPIKWKNENFDLQWGDMGIANFLISSEALVKRDFSKILFTWDCG